MVVPKLKGWVCALGALVFCVSVRGGEAGSVALEPALPKPTFEGTPIDVRSPHREPYRGDGVPPPPLLVPAGTWLFERGCAVTCNGSGAKKRDLALVTERLSSKK